MGEIKTWKAGKADEAWKVMICARDAMRAEDLLQGLAYILCDIGSGDSDACAKAISGLTGEQIANGLLAYRNSSIDSVKNALPRSKDTWGAG